MGAPPALFHGTPPDQSPAPHPTEKMRADLQLSVDTSMLLHHARDLALPFHEPVTKHIVEADKLYVVGDVRKVSLGLLLVQAMVVLKVAFNHRGVDDG